MNHMNRFVPLMQREWLQHRTSWVLLALIPLALGLVLTTFGQIEIDGDTLQDMGEEMAPLMALGSIAATTVGMFFIAWVASLVTVSGLPRRDHGDRSIEFWLSLPTPHWASFAAPLLVHLILVPAVALGVGLLGGYAISLVVVSRMVSFGAWASLPWGEILPASVVLVGRLLAGLPLATLWLAPLILLVMLLTAWFRRWGWVILALGMGLGGWLLKQVFGQPLMSEVTLGWMKNAATALIMAEGRGLKIQGPHEILPALQGLSGWAVHDLGMALANLASPLLAGGLALAAACFAALVLWRQRGAGVAGG